MEMLEKTLDNLELEDKNELIYKLILTGNKVPDKYLNKLISDYGNNEKTYELARIYDVLGNKEKSHELFVNAIKKFESVGLLDKAYTAALKAGMNKKAEEIQLKLHKNDEFRMINNNLGLAEFYNDSEKIVELKKELMNYYLKHRKFFWAAKIAKEIGQTEKAKDYEYLNELLTKN